MKQIKGFPQRLYNEAPPLYSFIVRWFYADELYIAHIDITTQTRFSHPTWIKRIKTFCQFNNLVILTAV
jgi:hypothetical protein